jgi:hypothetical protein
MSNSATLDFTIPAAPAGTGVPSYSANITLTLSSTETNGYYTVEGASGTIDIGGTTYNVTGLAALGTDGSDNLFNPNGTFSDPSSSTGFVDGDGIAFATSDPNADGAGSSSGSVASDVELYVQDGSDGLPNTGDYFVDTSSQGDTVTATSVTVSNVSLCFASGSRIRTVRGEIAVEELRVGDLALTAGGEARRIVWIGSRTIARPDRGQWPVRVRAGAFAGELPRRDLLLSPGHAVCVPAPDEVLIPIGELVNGASIAAVEVEEVSYWHIELESHDVLLAEGLPCESYMDCGNRGWFAGDAGTPDPERTAASLERYARPFVNGGAVLAALRQHLQARAEAQGWRRVQEMDPHLLVDGRRVEPTLDDDLAAFVFPADAGEVVLASRTWVPADDGVSGDRRRLGLMVRGLSVFDGLRVDRQLPLDEIAGFHPEELADRCAWRWTRGRLVLPRSLWAGCRGQVMLRLAFDPRASWFWAAPEPAAAEADRTAAARLSLVRRVA